MQGDFHYYATYCAAVLVGYSPEEALEICYSANFVDYCSATFLRSIDAPVSAATTQLRSERANAKTNLISRQGITSIWSSFHFLPADLNAEPTKVFRKYKEKYRLICGPNGDLLVDTVNLAKEKSLQHIGIAMHVLADSWAHRGFAGTPSLAINNVGDVFELIGEDGDLRERKLSFMHSPFMIDDLENGIYKRSLYQIHENAVSNLGHRRVGRLPDYSFIRYRYMPAWGRSEEMILKDNPSDYMHAFTQMIYALRFLRGEQEVFEKDTYDFQAISELKNQIQTILKTRRRHASEEWWELGETIIGKKADIFDLNRYCEEYLKAREDQKESTFLGKFINAAIAQKYMVSEKIYESRNRLAGIIKN